MNLYFTVFYLIFFLATFMLRSAIRNRTLSAERIKGKVIASWTSKYIFFAYLFILFGSLAEYFLLKQDVNLAVSFLGVLAYAGGIAGRQWSHRTLGKYWSVDIEIRENQEIIRAGPYKYMRHPNSLFHLIEVLGIVLVPNAYISLSVFLAAYLPVIVLRSAIEEKAMLESLNESYSEYMKKTWGLFPLTGRR